MATETERDDGLEAFFAAARAEAPEPGADLTRRILADADAETAARRRVDAVQSASRPGAFARLFELVGGWPGAAGLAAASLTGLWIGVADLGGVTGFATGATTGTGYDLTDLLPGYGDYALEEGQG